MLDRLLEYRKAVTICCGQSQEVDLEVRNPSVTEWHVAQRVFEFLVPVMELVFSVRLQNRGSFPILFQVA